MLQAADSGAIIVAAASDLAPIDKQMQALVPNLPLKFVFGSSGQLASQIRAGAPYDVYLSANLDFVRALESEGRLVAGTVRGYARGRLALCSKDGKVSTLEQLAGVRTIAIANPAHAPYGVAAKQALPASLAKKIVYAENVRQALQFVESGNAEAGIVAWTLVKDRPGAVLLPESLHAPIVQGLAVVRGKAASRAIVFADALTSKAGQAMLSKAGFSVGK